VAANGEFVGYYLEGTPWQWTPTSFGVLRNSLFYKVDAWTGHMYVPWTIFHYKTSNCSGTQFVAGTFLPQELFANSDPDRQNSLTALYQLASGTTSSVRVASQSYNGNCFGGFAPFDADLYSIQAATAVTKDMAAPVRIASP